MEQYADINKELNEISDIVSNLSKKNIFQIPEGYFEGLSQQILAKVHQSSGSFDSFNVSAIEEINAISPLLAGLKNKIALTIPDEYFEKLSDSVTEEIQKIDQKKIPPAPVFRIDFGASKWLRYAAAAIITGFIGTCVFLFTNNHSADYKMVAHDSSPAANTGLKDVSDAVLSDFLADLPNNLNTAVDSADAAFFSTAFLDINDQDLAGMIKEIPDTDLFSYQDDLQIRPVSL